MKEENKMKKLKVKKKISETENKKISETENRFFKKKPQIFLLNKIKKKTERTKMKRNNSSKCMSFQFSQRNKQRI